MEWTGNLEFYLKTEGCFVIKNDFNDCVVCHRYSTNPYEIDLDGRNIHVVWYQGNLKAFLNLASDDIEIISFERHDKKDIKFYEFKKLRNKLS